MLARKLLVFLSDISLFLRYNVAFGKRFSREKYEKVK